jgi:hypothetical protein
MHTDIMQCCKFQPRPQAAPVGLRSLINCLGAMLNRLFRYSAEFATGFRRALTVYIAFV